MPRGQRAAGTPEFYTWLCFEIGQLSAPVLPLVEGEPTSETFLNLDTRQMLYDLSWGTVKLQS